MKVVERLREQLASDGEFVNDLQAMDIAKLLAASTTLAPNATTQSSTASAKAPTPTTVPAHLRSQRPPPVSSGNNHAKAQRRTNQPH